MEIGAPAVLSSRLTFLCKFVLPALWIAPMGGVALAIWVGALHGKHGEPIPPVQRGLLPLVWVVGSSYIIYVSKRLKKVSLDGRTLRVSNYFREIGVPVEQISEVRERRRKGIMIELKLRGATHSGSSIAFMPEVLPDSGGTHPTTLLLRKLVS